MDRDRLARALLAGMQDMRNDHWWAFDDLSVRTDDGHSGDVVIETMGIDLRELADYVLPYLQVGQ